MLTLKQHYLEAQSPCEFAKGYLVYLSNILARLDAEIIEQIINTIEQTAQAGGTIYFIGNGGSASTASHFASDLSFNTRSPKCKPIKTVSLVDNTAVMTALANDEGYHNVFVQQLEVLLEPKDLVIALSVSGNSPNIIEAIRYAKEQGVLTIGCTGFDGGILQESVDINLHVPTVRGEYGPVEDVFQILDHLIYSYLRLSRIGSL